MNLFEILSHDERVIVFSNEGEGIIITWNRSLTFQAWYVQPNRHIDEFGIMTSGKDVRTYEIARKVAQAWFGSGIVDDRNDGC
jgi:hypothetical protein